MADPKKTKTRAAQKPMVEAPGGPPTEVEIRSEEIAHLAYFIWREEGCPEGRDTEHWLVAEQRLKAAAAFPE